MTLTDVYTMHFDFVFRSLRRLGVPPHALDDAVQDVFMVVHRRLGDFEGRSSIKTWLFGIARRVVRDHRPDPRQAASLDEAVPSSAEGPHETAEKAEAAQRLLALLDRLDDDKREAFVLVDLEEMTVPEAAEALGANINTVYARLRAARRELEEAVERCRAQEQRRAKCTV